MRNQLPMAVTITLLVASISGVNIGGSIDSVSTRNTTPVQSSCTVVAGSYLTVHVFDDPSKPIQNALVVINGTYICLDSRLNQSGRTDSNGDATFAVAPHPATYNVTVILPESYQNQTIVVTNIGTPNPTFHTTVRVGLHQLRASIILLGETCRFVNETVMPTLLFHFECTLGVDYNANDGSHPQVSILWTDSGWGGSFNSATSQWVQYRSPQGIECLNVTVTVSAPSYESGSDTLTMIDMVIPNPSGGYVHNCPWDRTATTAVPSGPVPGFPVESIITGLALGAVLILLRAKSCTRMREDSFRAKWRERATRLTRNRFILNVIVALILGAALTLSSWIVAQAMPCLDVKSCVFVTLGRGFPLPWLSEHVLPSIPPYHGGIETQLDFGGLGFDLAVWCW